MLVLIVIFCMLKCRNVERKIARVHLFTKTIQSCLQFWELLFATLFYCSNLFIFYWRLFTSTNLTDVKNAVRLQLQLTWLNMPSLYIITALSGTFVVCFCQQHNDNEQYLSADLIVI